MKTIKNLKLTGLILGLALMFNTASASLLIEPHLAYNLSGSGSGWNNHEYDYNGPQFGARLGYQGLGLMTGLDYTRSSYDQKDKSLGVTVTESMTRNELGIFVGYNFPIMLRAWGTYYFTNTSENAAGAEYSGNTKELGVGFTALPLLSINLMYRMVTFDEVNSISLNDDINISEISLGVSLPLTF